MLQTLCWLRCCAWKQPQFGLWVAESRDPARKEQQPCYHPAQRDGAGQMREQNPPRYSLKFGEAVDAGLTDSIEKPCQPQPVRGQRRRVRGKVGK